MICLVAAVGSTPSPVAAQPLTLSEVLLRVSQWTLSFERDFGNRVVDEAYEQRIVSAKGTLEQSRRYAGELLFYRDALHDTWSSYRRLTAVDGVPLERVSTLAPTEAAPTLEEFLRTAARIDAEATQHFLGPMPWKLHMPLLGLVFLHPLNRYRSQFEHAGEEVVRGRRTWVIRFSEHRSPTFVRSRIGDLFASGTFWILPDTGQVVRSHLVLGGSVSNRQARTQVTVDYGPSGAADLWAPVEMREVYDNPLIRDSRRTEGHATYARYRRFVLEDEAFLNDSP